MSEINRREFIAAAAATATLAFCHCQTALAQTTAPATIPSAKTVDVGPKSDYAADGMHDKFIATDHIVVTRESGKIFASSSKCTHQGADVRIQGTQLYCPKNKVLFSAEVRQGQRPAKNIPAAIWHPSGFQRPSHCGPEHSVPRGEMGRSGQFCHGLMLLTRNLPAVIQIFLANRKLAPTICANYLTLLPGGQCMAEINRRDFMTAAAAATAAWLSVPRP